MTAITAQSEKQASFAQSVRDAAVAALRHESVAKDVKRIEAGLARYAADVASGELTEDDVAEFVTRDTETLQILRAAPAIAELVESLDDARTILDGRDALPSRAGESWASRVRSLAADVRLNHTRAVVASWIVEAARQ